MKKMYVVQYVLDGESEVRERKVIGSPEGIIKIFHCFIKTKKFRFINIIFDKVVEIDNLDRNLGR